MSQQVPEAGRKRPRRGPVRLRDVEESDLPFFYDHQRDPEAVKMANFASRERDAFMAHWRKILTDETVIAKTILYEGKVAGNVVSFMRGDTREVGYWLGRETWGRGIATEALSIFLRQLKVRPLYAGVARGNRGSIRVLEKCGFTLSHSEGEECILKLC